MLVLLNLILAATLLEALALAVLSQTHLLPNLAAGLCLLLALRLALSGASWLWLCLCLTGALAAHAADLRLRWRPKKTARPD